MAILAAQDIGGPGSETVPNLDQRCCFLENAKVVGDVVDWVHSSS